MATERKPRRVTRRAVAETTKLADAQAAVREPGRKRQGPGDPFTGELRRREVLPLLVMHLMAKGPSYGNQLMDRISQLTEGVLSVNPNTMYPLLRQLESRGLIEGRWEHPERRSRRYYSLTAGREEGVPAASQGGAAVPRVGRTLDRRDRARGLWRATSAVRHVELDPDAGLGAVDGPAPLADVRRGLCQRRRAIGRVAGRGRQDRLGPPRPEAAAG